MAETKEWRVKVVERVNTFEWSLERARPIYDDTILYETTMVGVEWEWESGGRARSEKAAIAEAKAAKEALLLAEKQEAEAKYIELGD